MRYKKFKNAGVEVSELATGTWAIGGARYGEVNEKANNAYSFFARTALNNPSLDEIEHGDLVGCYIEATVEHETKPNKNDPAKTVTFVRLGDKKAASGFGKTAPKAKTSAAPATGSAKKSQKVNLDDLLG